MRNQSERVPLSFEQLGSCTGEGGTLAKQVLVVDDDGSIRGLVNILLRHDGFDVEAVENGRAAIAAIEKKNYDAVVLDLMMRDGTGEDVLRTLAVQRPDVKCVVVISASSAANLAAVDEAKRRGEVAEAVRHQ